MWGTHAATVPSESKLHVRSRAEGILIGPNFGVTDSKILAASVSSNTL